MKTKKPIAGTKGVLKIKLGCCMSGPNERMVTDLNAIALECNHARNAMVRFWERWHEDHRGWKPSPDPVPTKRGKEYTETPLGSYDCMEEMRGYARKSCPSIAGVITSSLHREVVARLKTRLPYDHPSDAKYRYEGVLRYEVTRDCYRGLCIPVPNNSSVFCYEGDCSRELTKGVMERVRSHGKSSSVIRFPLLSDDTGRKVTDIICRLEVGQLSQGNKELLKRIAAKQDGFKMADSELVCKEGAWFLHMVYDQPIRDLGFPEDQVAVLMPCPADDTNPFSIVMNPCKAWKLGHTKILLAESERIKSRVKSLQQRYRNQLTEVRGRGRRKYYEQMKPGTRQFRFLQMKFSEQMVAEVMKYLTRYRCGKLLYREPTMPVRTVEWFSERNLTFDWTKFLANLTQKTKLLGIEIEVARLSMGEYKELGNKEKVNTPIVIQHDERNGVTVPAPAKKTRKSAK